VGQRSDNRMLPGTDIARFLPQPTGCGSFQGLHPRGDLMKRSLFVMVVGLIMCLFVVACSEQPNAKVDVKVVVGGVDLAKKPADTAPSKKPLPRKVKWDDVREIHDRPLIDDEPQKGEVIWRRLAGGTSAIEGDSKTSRGTDVHIDLWVNGKPSQQIETVELGVTGSSGRRWLSDGSQFGGKWGPEVDEPPTEVYISTSDADYKGNKFYKIYERDNLAGINIYFEFPANMAHCVSPMPQKIVGKQGVAVPFLYFCIGKDCTLREGESAEDLAKRSEYAFVLSLFVNEKKKD
jgi:hypothetical protein